MRLWLTGGNIVDAQTLTTSDQSKAGVLSVTLEHGRITAFNAGSAASEADNADAGLRFEIGRELIEALSFDTGDLVPLASIEARAPEGAP